MSLGHVWSFYFLSSSFLEIWGDGCASLSCQAENYPTEVAALSKKMVQATLEIYKNTWLRRWQGLLTGLLPVNGCKMPEKKNTGNFRHPNRILHQLDIFFRFFQTLPIILHEVSNDIQWKATHYNPPTAGAYVEPSLMFFAWYVFVYCLWISCPITRH